MVLTVTVHFAITAPVIELPAQVEEFVTQMIDGEVVNPDLLNAIQEVLGKTEYNRLMTQLDEPALEDPKDHDDLGFLIDRPKLHEAMLKHQGGRAEVLEQQREDWVAWLAQDKPTELQELQRGVPMELRTQVYQKAMASSMKELQGISSSYEDLIQQAAEITKAAAAAPDNEVEGAAAQEMIEKDLDRTFPGHTFFETPEGVEALRNLLRAYAAFDPDVGYCQSMNFIGAVVLLAMGIRDDPGHEEQAFWMFAKHPYGA